MIHFWPHDNGYIHNSSKIRIIRQDAIEIARKSPFLNFDDRRGEEMRWEGRMKTRRLDRPILLRFIPTTIPLTQFLENVFNVSAPLLNGDEI